MWASQLHWFLKEHLDGDRIRSKYVGVVINKFLIYIAKYFVLTVLTFVRNKTKLWNRARRCSCIFRLRDLPAAWMIKCTVSAARARHTPQWPCYHYQLCFGYNVSMSHSLIC